LARLTSAYDAFDTSRNRLRNVPEGAASGSSSICSACLAIDIEALTLGIITDIAFAISLKRHVEWLDRMADPNGQYSIPSLITKTLNAEQKIVEETKKSAERDDDVPSQIALALYQSPTAQICIRHTMRLQFFTGSSPTQMGSLFQEVNGSMTYVFSYSRVEVENPGATFLAQVKLAPRIGSALHMTAPDAGYSYDLPEKLDLATCRIFDNGTYLMDLQESNRAGFFKKVIQHQDLVPHVSGHLIHDSLRYHQLADEIHWKPAAKAQLIFDKINLERLKRAFASECLKLVVAHRDQATRLISSFPDVGDLK
jgi:hypothetical protein